MFRSKVSISLLSEIKCVFGINSSGLSMKIYAASWTLETEMSCVIIIPQRAE